MEFGLEAASLNVEANGLQIQIQEAFKATSDYYEKKSLIMDAGIPTTKVCRLPRYVYAGTSDHQGS